LNAIVFNRGGGKVFYYYGRKKQIAKHYPAPEFDTIIEPFAGAASYALHSSHWQKQVILVERDHRVAEIWRWLIESATEESIRALPDLSVGERSTEFLHIVHAATKMAFKYKRIKVTPVLERNWEISKRVMAASLYKVRHWKIMEADFTAAPDLEATWFIDPPYKDEPGNGYAHGSSALDYSALAAWVYERKGQVICCEGANGDYLPFTSLLDLPGVAGKRSKEVVYCTSSPKRPQMSLFASL
jgi:16S rRNA G966 N2-methylase RsmD